jgi:hypothetical protein
MGSAFAEVGLIMDLEISDLGRATHRPVDDRSDPPGDAGRRDLRVEPLEWLEGEQFRVFRSHYDHPEIPDATSIIGDTDGLHMHYFDSRGVYRLFAMR